MTKFEIQTTTVVNSVRIKKGVGLRSYDRSETSL